MFEFDLVDWYLYINWLKIPYISLMLFHTHTQTHVRTSIRLGTGRINQFPHQIKLICVFVMWFLPLSLLASKFGINCTFWWNACKCIQNLMTPLAFPLNGLNGPTLSHINFRRFFPFIESYQKRPTFTLSVSLRCRGQKKIRARLANR